MAEHAAPARKTAAPAPVQEARSVRAADRQSALPNRRSEALLGGPARLLDARAAAVGAAAPGAPMRSGGARPIQRAAANRTGLPDRLKAGVEGLSGFSMDDVRVHRNSREPAKLGAFAYARGSDIHLGPGQEQHLPHEAWHVVQQKQGRVAPTLQAKGMLLNDDQALEGEADTMGKAAARAAAAAPRTLTSASPPSCLVQRAIVQTDPTEIFNRNVAAAWKGGGDYAVTPTIINGRTIPPSSNKKGLFVEPTYHIRETGSQVQAEALRLDFAVGTQSVGYRLELPIDGPWDLDHTVPVEEMDAFLREAGKRPPPVQPKDEKKPATLRIESDGDLAGQIRKHEMHHVKEQEDAIEEILEPWDADLEARTGPAANLRAFDPLTLFSRFNALGNGKAPATAQSIADSLVARLAELGDAYHDTDEGKPPVVSKFDIKPGKDRWDYRIWLKLKA